MKAVDIIPAVSRRLKKIRRHYTGLLIHYDLEEIHDFRLEVKKLRAFIRLVNTGRPAEKKMKLGGKLKAFYRAAGDIRNLQLHRQRVVQLCSGLQVKKTEAYLQLLQQEEAERKKTAASLAARISLAHFEKQIRSFTPHKLKAAVIQRFLSEKATAMRQLILLSLPADEELHELRKLLKDLLYTWKYISSFAPGLLPDYFTSPEHIDELAAKLGDLNDLVVSTHLLRAAYVHDRIDEDEKTRLLMLSEQLGWQKNALRAEVLATLRRIKQQIHQEHFQKLHL